MKTPSVTLKRAARKIASEYNPTTAGLIHGKSIALNNQEVVPIESQ